MKAFCSIAALSISLLLASCSFTQQQVEDSAVDTPEAEKPREITGNPFSTRARKPRAKEVDATVLEHEAPTSEPEAAPTPTSEPEAAPTPTSEPEAAPTPASEPTPTPAQQEAAARLLSETPAPEEEEALSSQSHSGQEASVGAAAAANLLPPAGRSLRMGSIVPQEEETSASDAPPPGANSVELRGLRSPKLPSGLPMGIDGKLNNQR